VIQSKLDFEKLKPKIISLASDGLSKKDVASLVGISRKTLSRWSQADSSINQAFNAKLNHHLKIEGGKPIQMRVNLDNGKKIGKRLTISLSTKDVEEARIRRDLFLVFFNKAGVKLTSKISSKKRIRSKKNEN